MAGLFQKNTVHEAILAFHRNDSEARELFDILGFLSKVDGSDAPFLLKFSKCQEAESK